MKKLIIILLCLGTIQAFSQSDEENPTKQKFNFGMDVFTDIWQDIPEGLDLQTINMGVSMFGSYNFMFGESNFSFSPGVGLTMHNFYGDSWLVNTTDSSYFELIPDDIGHKKSKFNVNYVDIPMEFRFKSESDFRLAVGFKFGFLLQAHTKFKGDDYIAGTTDRVIIKKSDFNHMEKNRYGFTGRIGYKWLNVWGYYQLSSMFIESKGPNMYPISVGITIIPF